MHHVCVSQVALGTTANTLVPAIPDQILSIDSSSFFSSVNLKLIAAFAGSATLQRVRLESPELRQLAMPYLYPIQAALLPADNPAVADFRKNPLHLQSLERWAPYATSGIAMGTETCNVVQLVMSDYQTAPVGDLTILRATGATTVTANTWSDVTLTWDQQLAKGRYSIIGGQCAGATIIAWRLILDNQFWRPGGVGQLNTVRRSHEMFRGGGLGEWGQFLSTGLPRLQVFCTSADTSQELWLETIRIGA